MFKKIFILLFFGSLFCNSVFALSNQNEIVKIDETTFVLVKHLTTNNESVSAILSLFKVEGDKIYLKDELHYQAGVQLTLRSKNDKISIERFEPPTH